MRHSIKMMVALPMLLGMWIVLAGADQGCFHVDPGCDGLDEQACIDDEGCRPVYMYPNRYDDELPCGSDGTRCIGAEPEFDYCEAKPDCENLGEQACVGEDGCQAIYGYPEDYPAYGYNEDQPRCAPGTRCIMPPETFIECLDAEADPCEGLGEQECWRRPMCVAEYQMTMDIPVEDSYLGCFMRLGECTYDYDCYNQPIDLVDPGCPDYFFTCEDNHCVVNCPDVGCESDADCGQGGRCEIRCDDNGWCQGECVDEPRCFSDADCPEGEYCFMDDYCDDEYCGGGTCLPIEQGCLDDADCAAGQHCAFPPCECHPDDPDCDDHCLGAGVCVDDSEVCRSDLDCGEGFHCEFTDWCDDGWCGVGTCVADHTGCQTDADCDPSMRCEVYCGNGWCHGECLRAEAECYTDADCAEDEFCQSPPDEQCADFGNCPGTCEAGIWTFTEPVQCGGNAWEVDAQESPERYIECIANCEPGTNCGGTFTEICIVRTFFFDQGIALHDIRDVYNMGDVCASCACPRGDTLYALVAPADLDRLLEWGFSIY